MPRPHSRHRDRGKTGPVRLASGRGAARPARPAMNQDEARKLAARRAYGGFAVSVGSLGNVGQRCVDYLKLPAVTWGCC